MVKKAKQYKKGIYLFLFFFLLSVLITIGNWFSPYNAGFDSQEFLTWDYLATTGQKIYRDYYYPYGIINIIKEQSLFFLLVYVSILPLLFLAVHFFFSKFWKDTFLTYTFFIGFSIFVFAITGTPTFTRYGITFVIGLLYAYIFSNKKLISKKTSYLLGGLNGIIFSLLYDQGTYSLILYVIGLITFPFFSSGFSLLKSRKFYLFLAQHFCSFILGFLTTSSVFFIYLYLSKSLEGFMSNLTTVGDIALYAKTPYFHSLKSFDGVFNLLIVFSTITYLFYKLVVKKSKFTFQLAVIFITLISLLLLEQKSIIRTIDWQLTFISFFLGTILFYDFFNSFKNHKINRYVFIIFYIFFLCLLVFLLGLKNSNIYNNNLKTLNSSNPEFNQVLSNLEKRTDFVGKVYSFPGDPIFYTLLQQKPPYYSAIYQASPLYAQEKIIQYIKNENIQYVIYNYKNLAIQDEVPNYARVPELHKYILTTFSPIEKINNFLILKKNINKEDFFNNEIIDNTASFKNYLFNVHLANIPRSEGIYKKQYLNQKNIKTIFDKGSIDEFNTFLHKNDISSKNKLFVLYFNQNNTKEQTSEIVIKTRDGSSTKIEFNTCEIDIPCIINISHVPLFYRERVFQDILVNTDKIQAFSVLENYDYRIFW